jgi:hypothetical protein
MLKRGGCVSNVGDDHGFLHNRRVNIQEDTRVSISVAKNTQGS